MAPIRRVPERDARKQLHLKMYGRRTGVTRMLFPHDRSVTPPRLMRPSAREPIRRNVRTRLPASLYYTSLRLQPFPLPSGSSRLSDNWSVTGLVVLHIFTPPAIPAAVGLVPAERQNWSVTGNQLYYTSLRLQPFPLPSGSLSRRSDNWSVTGLVVLHIFTPPAIPAAVGLVPAERQNWSVTGNQLYYTSLRLQPFPLPSGLSRRSDNWSVTGSVVLHIFTPPAIPAAVGLLSRRSDNWSVTGLVVLHIFTPPAIPAAVGLVPAERQLVSHRPRCTTHLYASSHSRCRRACPGGATTGQLPAISAETPFHGPGWSGRAMICS